MVSNVEQLSHIFLSTENGQDDTKKSFLSHFGFEINPFSDSVNTEFYFQSKEHKDIYEKMKLCVEQNISLGLCAGQSGTGKTMITQLLLNNLDKAKYKTVVVLISPGMTKTSLLKEILSELNVPSIPNTGQTYELLRILQEEVIRTYQDGRRFVIMIDEAHFLDSSALHLLRTISNIEIPSMKLVTTLLFSEEVILRRLKYESYNSLRNRMYVKEVLYPFSYQETKDYIRFRIAKVGGNPDIFDEETFQIIFTATAGIAREINNLCYSATTEAYLADMNRVTNKVLVKCLE